jgi:hypothetical protein
MAHGLAAARRRRLLAVMALSQHEAVRRELGHCGFGLFRR